MIPAYPGSLIPCIPPIPCIGLPSVGPAIAGAAASGIFSAFTSSLSSCASWLIRHVIFLIQTAPPVNLGAEWFNQEEGLMATVMELLVLPLLMAASIGTVLRQDLRRLGRVWAVGLPVAILSGLGGSQLATLGVDATDGLCNLVLSKSSAPLGKATDMLGGVSGSPQFVQIAIFLLMIVATVLVWLELLVRTSAIYIAMFFAPLALAGYVWPATTAMARRVVELIVALILSKFVIVATLALGMTAMGQGTKVDDAVVGIGILLIAAFAPFVLLRLAPIAEMAAIAHLEGLSRRPFRAAARTATAAAGAPAHPVVKLLGAKFGSSAASVAPSSVRPQPLAERPPDDPTTRVGGSDG